MNDEFAFGLLCFISLFAVVEPLGTMPVFVSLTAGLDAKQSRSVAIRAVIIAMMILLVFAFGGQLIFRLFGISINSLKVVGGIIFLLIGYEMLQAHLTRTAFEEESPHDYGRDIALTPLGMPMICGPGAIANVMILWNEANTIPRMIAMLIALTLVMLLTLVILIGARQLARFLGDSGNKVLLRLMGLITMVIGVEIFFAGLKPIIRDILQP